MWAVYTEACETHEHQVAGTGPVQANGRKLRKISQVFTALKVNLKRCAIMLVYLYDTNEPYSLGNFLFLNLPKTLSGPFSLSEEPMRVRKKSCWSVWHRNRNASHVVSKYFVKQRPKYVLRWLAFRWLRLSRILLVNHSQASLWRIPAN